MTMTLFLPIALAVLAGLLNGSYLSPLKKGESKTLELENNYVWMLFSLLTFFALPLLVLLYLIFWHPLHIPLHDIIYIVATGLIYGLGMYFLTKSVQYIGLGIPFALSIAMGTLSGSLFSLIVSGKFYMYVSKLLVLSYGVFIVSIVLYGISLMIRDKGINKVWLKGLLLCLFSSVLCAFQGACLGFFADYFKATQQGFLAQLFPWSLIFISCSFIFMALYYWDIKKIKEPLVVNKRYIVDASLAMTAFYALSIVSYTVAINDTRGFSEAYLWVIFMGCIILSSTAWSYLKGEWQKSPVRGHVVNATAILFLVGSLVLLTLSKL